MIDTLIKMFKLARANPDAFCDGGTVGEKCSGISCHDCPFSSTSNLNATIVELEKAQEKQDV
ncbi:hypothetical protein ECBP5_0014 [Escherichia phage ECBP5]|uniref:Uncharacterized protein n=1 Tax=Escherichia phage ECBP5 TaxID=1498172 RepID=A0A0F6N5N2_9CAUD|nr:hypothetical protein ECBP5_0014 [Escherichia phage ECBP5]AID17668.1 hypothetical protein ECBP5_0014 [Escherichia phage ECBP5]